MTTKCDPYGDECFVIFVSMTESKLRDYADILGRYIWNPWERVEWAPERPVYERVNKERGLIWER